jgi:hypothetical protein
MAANPLHEAELRAMDHLGWTANDLYLATFGYGDVGSLHDVQEHLRTGDHLSPAKKNYVAAALWDAELDATSAQAPKATGSVDAVARPTRSIWQRVRRRLARSVD